MSEFLAALEILIPENVMTDSSMEHESAVAFAFCLSLYGHALSVLGLWLGCVDRNRFLP